MSWLNYTEHKSAEVHGSQFSATVGYPLIYGKSVFSKANKIEPIKAGPIRFR